MGLFDYRCMISGLSLKSSETVLVLLEKNGEEYIPVALPVFGQYNRSGAIDMIEENDNTEKITDFLLDKLDNDEAELDWDEVYWEGEPIDGIESIEQLIVSIERGVTMEYDCFVLNGKRIEYALVDRCVWKTLASSGKPGDLSSVENSEIWKEIYSNKFPGYDDLLLQMKNVQNFLSEKSIKWYPPRESGQHYHEEVKEFIEEAKNKYKNSPVMLTAIIEYEKRLEENK